MLLLKPHVVGDERAHRILNGGDTQYLVNPGLPLGDDVGVTPAVVLNQGKGMFPSSPRLR